MHSAPRDQTDPEPLPPVQVLRPQPAPKAFTAARHVTGLHEHFLAFLNANNANGFVMEDVIEVEAPTIGSIMQQALDNPYLTLDRFKQFAKRIKKVANHKRLKHTTLLNILAVSFGYDNYDTVVHAAAANEGILPRIRDVATINQELFGLKPSSPATKD
jgi:hypothetical protein